MVRCRWSQFLTPVSLSLVIRPLFVRKMQLEEQEIYIQAQMLELQKERFVASVSLEKRHGNGDDENVKRANGVGIEA
ncbi:hypothetical protein L1987_72819 [Smallanthus sonchifolius]|uniref:Uncharacterized protein n=1 Tax=Smallanthus sonchifolius TaxID=185202 RepID=A0ACB9AWJ6_9ASTR|nr:hypothetical protein L1987_72819 [Smallanthus sonchifolius]